MQRYFFLGVFLLVGSLTLGCAPEEGPPPEAPEEALEQEPAAPALPPEELVTRNVTYTGLLEEGGVTIYQQGTHRLALSDGKMILLEPVEDPLGAEGSAIPLELYVGKLVRVQGDVLPTVEAGGTLMKVAGIAWVRREKNAEGAEIEVLRTLCGGASNAGCPEGFTCTLEENQGICMEAKQEETATGAEVGAPVATAPVQGEEMDERVLRMQEEDYAPERWTQQYCSAHVGFCIPIHRNHYFNAFGAMNSVLWHVEVGDGPVENLGDGPIAVDLKLGDLAALSVEDGAVMESGGKVTGYRQWSDNRHFEISAPSALHDAVSYITGKLAQAEE